MSKGKYDEMKNVIRSAKSNWLSEADIADILVNYVAYGFPISSSAAQKPISSGSLFLYNTTLGTDWKRDGYNWDSRREKVLRFQITVYGPLVCLVSEGNGIARRGYWLESQTHIILTHYLENPSENSVPTNGLPIFSSDMAQDQMIHSNMSMPAKEAKCDVFLNPDVLGNSNLGQSSGMRRIKTSPGALSSLVNDTHFGFATPVDQNSLVPNFLADIQADQPGGMASIPPTQVQASPMYNVFQTQGGGNAQQVDFFNNTATAVAASANNSTGATTAGQSSQNSGMRRIMSSPMPLDRLDKGMNGDGDKTSKRKARKAEVARACRKRKKAYIQSLEQKAAALQRKLTEMAGNASKSKSEKEMHREEQQRILNALEAALGRQPHDIKEIKMLVQQFVTNSRQHKDLFWRHAEDTLGSINPGAQAKFALWGLDQDDEFYEKPGLWKTLMSDEIGLDDSQMKKLLRCRERVRESKNELIEIQNRLISLRKIMNDHLSKRYKLLDRLLETLKPVQVARFFLWVSKNSSCMQMLQTVWKVPDESIVTSAKEETF
mmetsp:Transcript_22320/g.31231  ORF Transcript_22320/g.31231 Transcript_22320/m.31231 type:complete len:548 (+) Transcript_22320:65-1708(+)